MRRWLAYWTRCRKGDHQWEFAALERRYRWPRAFYVHEECVNCVATRETEVKV